MIQPRILAAAAVAALAVFAVPTMAVAADAKVAVVRFDDAVRASPQYKVADQKMTAEFQKRKSDLEAQSKQFESDVEKFKRDRVTVSPDAAAKTEKDLAARQVDLSQAGRKFQEDAQTRQRELTNEVVSKVRDAVVAVAKEKSLDVVVADPVFANTSFDITDDVVKKLGGTSK
ncbi:OmpH family outer membrane protein [uncultured Nevskia sp.]|uniref:OmpH family outer membrane protein n=1 Tax=uncultured Nevskia sp. TaxID=228950 RepID=UPI0025FEBB66|nr:OmpH family outer membrane protein [uncultured Nevskia sp.]